MVIETTVVKAPQSQKIEAKAGVHIESIYEVAPAHAPARHVPSYFHSSLIGAGDEEEVGRPGAGGGTQGDARQSRHRPSNNIYIYVYIYNMHVCVRASMYISSRRASRQSARFGVHRGARARAAPTPAGREGASCGVCVRVCARARVRECVVCVCVYVCGSYVPGTRRGRANLPVTCQPANTPAHSLARARPRTSPGTCGRHGRFGASPVRRPHVPRAISGRERENGCFGVWHVHREGARL